MLAHDSDDGAFEVWAFGHNDSVPKLTAVVGGFFLLQLKECIQFNFVYYLMDPTYAAERKIACFKAR